jgi:hypothetical protein
LGFQSKVFPGNLTDLSAWVGFCASSPQQGVKYQLWYLNFVLWRRVSVNIPWKIYQGRQSSCPLGVSIKDIARAFNWFKCLSGFPHLNPTVGCQISTLICSEVPCSGIFPILQIATSFPEFPYWWVIHEDLHKGFQYN